MKEKHKRTGRAIFASIIFSFVFLMLYGGAEARTITADVVAFDQPIMFNRLGAQNVNGMMYALRRDVVPINPTGGLVAGNVMLRPDKRPRPLVLRVAAGDTLSVKLTNLLDPTPNNAVNAPPFVLPINEQVTNRLVGFHPNGLQLVSINDDSSNVGQNANSLVPQGGFKTYTFYAPKEGTFVVQSYNATFGSDGNQGNSANGLFAVVNVEPAGAKFYRSQLTEEEMRLAADRNNDGVLTVGDSELTAAGHPIINYEATYPAKEAGGSTDTIWVAEGKAGLPILNMLRPVGGNYELVHSDINAIIVGPNLDGTFPRNTYPAFAGTNQTNPTLPNRLEPFREFTVVFHDEVAAAQAFPGFFKNDLVFARTLAGVKDGFMINYGSGGIGSEIIASRLKVGPMHDCLTCAYEEFFLTSYTVGDPAMIVDVPANAGLENLLPGGSIPAGATGPKATKAFYPDDPSNVHHAYISDFVKFRNVHVGKEQHIFHLHNHQWLFNPNDDNSNYVDAQAVGPGSGYTYEINFGGSGNRNKTAGDAIFHCHFYPHFAQGMWALYRIHDVFETGTLLDVTGGATSFHTAAFALMDGTPATDPAGGRVRALPDGEIVAGTPIPGVVPLPGKPMAPMPGKVTVVANANTTTASTFNPTPATADLDSNTDGVQVPVGSNAKVINRNINPGFPFWIAGIEHIVGQRPTTPPLDMLASAGGWDGGLPRHALDGFAAGGTAVSKETPLDFSKTVTKAKPVYFPEEGTDVEQTAMAFHAQKFHPSFLPDGTPAPGTDTISGIKGFRTNGAPPVPSAPFFEPCIDDDGDRLGTGVTGNFFDGNGGKTISGSPTYNADNPRVYKGANIQFDAVFNKLGYHYPQQRIIALWDDVMPTINKTRPPEPLVMRMNTFDCVKYLHTNLVPEVYELDDYQVKTPTDIIGQHIHLPKWDLVSNDGAANGWNYEDGTLAPGAVRERIHAINEFNLGLSSVTLDVQGSPVKNSRGTTIGARLEPLPHDPYFGNKGRADWLGARTTIQRWFSDPVVNAAGVHRGLGIIFTHDHYGPSTHQQIGLYATVLNEPPGSTWRHNETGVLLGTRHDGGPTSWQAAIVTPNLSESHREFYLEFSDFQHAYEAGVYIGADKDGKPNHVLPDANSFRFAVNPPFRQEANPIFPDVVLHPADCIPGAPGQLTRPCPTAISFDDPGFLVVNYRNEPVGWRVYDPAKIGPDGKLGTQADGLAGDLAFALQSRSDRKVPQLNTRLGNTPYPALTNDVNNGDPFTPILRANAGDLVRIKTQAGGHEHEHNFGIHGIKWLQGGSGFGKSPNSGWRNAQNVGISEQFTLTIPVVPFVGSARNQADYAYATDTSNDGWWSGIWGLLRTYNVNRRDLYQLPNTTVPLNVANANLFNGVCPTTSPVRSYDITAVLANEVLINDVSATILANEPRNLGPRVLGRFDNDNEGGPLDPLAGTLVYNAGTTLLTNGMSGPLHDPTAIMYVRTADLDVVDIDPNTAGVQPAPGCFRTDPVTLQPVFDRNLPTCPLELRAGVPVEPLVLRANAGECVNVTLRNHLPGDLNGNGFFDDNPDLAGYTQFLQVVPRDKNGVQGVTWFNSNLVRPSSWVGLHPQLVAFDVTRDDGTVVGQNPQGFQLVSPGGNKTSRWYAGDISFTPAGRGRVNLVATAVELGGSNLIPADKIKQGQKGLIGALIIEPAGSAWTEDPDTRTAATVGPDTNPADGMPDSRAFRDFAAVFQKGLNLRYSDGTAVENLAAEGVGIPEDSHDSGAMAINYGTEPLWFRFGLAPNVPFGNAGLGSFGGVANADEAYSNTLVSAACAAAPALPECDPATPVFKARPNDRIRFRLAMPTGVGRGTTFTLHGNLWQRDPYLAGAVPSQTIGVNPNGLYLGSQESVTPGGHFDILPLGYRGNSRPAGDYLFRDQASFGNTQGLWGILRINQAAP